MSTLKTDSSALQLESTTNSLDGQSDDERCNGPRELGYTEQDRVRCRIEASVVVDDDGS